jgi:hypothetical protein
VKRYTASDITDDALDALYANANKGWRRGDRWKERALAAEAAIERVTSWCDQLDQGVRTLTKEPTAEHPVAANVRQRLAAPEESTTP